MSIGVHREADLRVAQDFHHVARVDALRDQECRTGMAEVMEAQPGQDAIHSRDYTYWTESPCNRRSGGRPKTPKSRR